MAPLKQNWCHKSNFEMDMVFEWRNAIFACYGKGNVTGGKSEESSINTYNLLELLREKILTDV